MNQFFCVFVLCFVSSANSEYEFGANSTTEASNSTKDSSHVTTTSPAVKFVKCSDPSSHINETIRGMNGVDGIGLIQHFCPELASKSPFTEWLPGVNVAENCHEIPHLTPIATFLSSGKSYGGDSAIFDSCDNQTVVRVFYQNGLHPIEHRILALKGDPIDNAKYYFTVNYKTK